MLPYSSTDLSSVSAVELTDTFFGCVFFFFLCCCSCCFARQRCYYWFLKYQVSSRPVSSSVQSHRVRSQCPVSPCRSHCVLFQCFVSQCSVSQYSVSHNVRSVNIRSSLWPFRFTWTEVFPYERTRWPFFFLFFFFFFRASPLVMEYGWDINPVFNCWNGRHVWNFIRNRHPLLLFRHFLCGVTPHSSVSSYNLTCQSLANFGVFVTGFSKSPNYPLSS